MLEIIAGAVMLLWPLTEMFIALTRRARASRDEQIVGGGAGVVWAAALSGMVGAMVCWWLGVLPLPVVSPWMVVLGALLVAAGAAFRLWAITTLGAFFTVDVVLRCQHELVTDGPYRLVRHPAYTGLLLSFLGLGVASQSWLGLLLAVGPVTVALVRRIAVEEKALASCFGESYRRYCRRTKRLVPFLY